MKSNDDETLEQIIYSMGGLLFLSTLPASFLTLFCLKNPNHRSISLRLVLVFLVIIVLCALALLEFAGLNPKTIQYLLLIQTLLVLLSPVIARLKRRPNILRLIDFKNVKNKGVSLNESGAQNDGLPIGYNIKTNALVRIPSIRRSSHVLVIGATGTGKTTLMLNMIKHAVINHHPCVVIDPKGEDSTLLALKRFMKKQGVEERLKVFSMSKPSESAKYNPLKHGNANQLKDRVMEALNWSEQYYQSMAGSFLTALTSATSHAGLPLTLDLISRLLTYKEEQALLLKRLREMFQAGDEYALSIYERINTFFSKKGDDLAGLHSQISILNNPTFGHILSFKATEDDLDLRRLRLNKGVAYFQLDTLGNADSARRLGRMIIEDLKSLSSEVYKTEPDQGKRPFYPVFIDEFGSFAATEFIEMLKQSRGARFGVHLFCQGLEDLDTVSPEFRRQVLSNALTKVALRVDDNETVEEFCGSAGTVDAIEQSYQVSGNLLKTRTGQGNERLTKQMLIEHDVLKNLSTGQAVVIDKGIGESYGIEIPSSIN